MPSFDEKTEILLQKLGRANSLIDARQGDRVFTLHYEPQEWAEVRQKLPRLKARLRENGFHAEEHTFAESVSRLLEADPFTKLLISGESGNLSNESDITNDLGDCLGVSRHRELSLESPITVDLLGSLFRAAAQPNGILLVTDLEMLHPFGRVSAFEQILQSRFLVPTVFLYPGLRGAIGDTPSFLGVFPSGGNYRSTHIY
jgi:hypothetical protein